MNQTAPVAPAVRPEPRGPAPTVAGLLVGVQAALLSWIAVVAPTVAAFTATSGMAYNAGRSWADAGRFGSDLWVLGHFGATMVGSGAERAAVSLSPVGIALISVLACAALPHSTTVRGWPLVGGGVVGFVAVDGLIAYVLAGDATASAPAALAGGAAAALIGLVWGNRPHGDQLAVGAVGAWGRRRPPDLSVGLRAGWTMAAGLLAASAALTLVAAVGGAARYRQVFASLGTDAVGGLALILLCLALIPNALLWGVAYLSGTGFAVGAGSRFGPLELAEGGGAEPALPIFALLPTTAPPAAFALMVGVPVAVGVAGGWAAGRRVRAELPEAAWWRPVWAAVGGGVAAAVGLAVVAWLASGAVGPGRMAQVGVAVWPLAGWLALELAFGAAFGALALARPWRRRDGVGGAGGPAGFGGGGEAGGD